MFLYFLKNAQTGLLKKSKVRTKKKLEGFPGIWWSRYFHCFVLFFTWLLFICS